MRETSLSAESSMDLESYLRRIGVAPSAIEGPDLETLGRLHRAHVLTVPFENLSIIGDPHGPYKGERIELDLPTIYEKIVEHERGGYCFELNALFHWALDRIGFDVHLAAARVLQEDSATPPANHLVIIVDLGERYLADVGLGRRKLRRPLPIPTDSPATMPHVEWRVVPTDRPDEDFVVQQRSPGTDWSPTYVFTDKPRELWYFEALNDYLQTAPESPFTGNPLCMIETEDGYCSCSGDTLRVVGDEEETEQSVSAEDWHDLLEHRFGLRIG